MKRIQLHISDKDQGTLAWAQLRSRRSEAADAELDRWMNGDYGPVLFAPRIDRCSATRTANATLEFTKPFLEFLAALRAGNFDGKVS